MVAIIFCILASSGSITSKAGPLGLSLGTGGAFLLQLELASLQSHFVNWERDILPCSPHMLLENHGLQENVTDKCSLICDSC